MSEAMIYNKAGLADLSSGLISYAQELDQVGQEAHQLLAGSQQFFQGDSGAQRYAAAQQLINEGIQDGKEVIYRHGNQIDTSSQNFSAADQQVGQGFDGI